jgi:hypothetical protein
VALALFAILALALAASAFFIRRLEGRSRFLGFSVRRRTDREIVEEMTRSGAESDDPAIRELQQKVADIWETLRVHERRLDGLEGDAGGGWEG